MIKTTLSKLISNGRYLLATGKPYVIARYVKKYALALFLNKQTLRQIDIALTFDCNMTCDHCFTAPLYNPSESEMSYDVLQQVAGDCLEAGITVIHFTGGEVLMREDLESVIQLFNPRKNIIYIQSNGTLGSFERFRSLKKAGLDFFGASLEYPDKAQQDRFRHYDGYFDKTLAVLNEARRAGLQTSVNITIDSTLIHSPDLPELIEMLGKKGHIVYGNLPVPVGRFSHRKELLWDNNERKRLSELTRTYPFFRTEFDSNFGPKGCPALKEKIYLCAYGDVLTCPYIHVSLGNVNNDSLNAIIKRGDRYDVFRHYHDHCLAAENSRFIETIIEPAASHNRQPVPYQTFDTELRAFDMPEQTEKELTDLELNETQCPFCGGSSTQDVVKARDYETPYLNQFSVVRCVACDGVYTSPSPSEADLFTYFYNDDYLCYTDNGAADALRQTYLCKARFNVFKKILPNGGNFLDVGCSFGYFLEFLQTNTDWGAYGCEPNLNMATAAAERGLDVKAKTLTEAEYPDSFFDMVYMSHVLEHVPNLVETINEVLRILKPGGIFLTENPDFDSPIRKPFGPAWWGYHLPRHLTHFTHDSMKKLLHDSGFSVQRITPCFRPGPIAWSIQNMLKERNAPSLLIRLFGLQNPFFVAAMIPAALFFLKKGHTDMMETLAVKPAQKCNK